MKIDCNRPKGIRIGIAVACILLFVALSTERAFAQPLRLGVYKGIHSALMYVADMQGFFRKQGVDVVMNEYETGPMAVNNLVADKVDVATAAEFAFVSQSFRYPDLRMPATICRASDFEVVARKDRGIARPQDLAGKRIALLRGGQAEFFLYNFLIFNRIPAGSVQIVDRTPSQMIGAMADGTIDAAISSPPYTTEMANQLGASAARWTAQSGQDYYQVLFAKESFLKKQPKTIEQFLAALSDAEGFISKYPERAQTILSQRLKLDSKSFLPTWPLYHFQLQLTQDLLVLMEREAKWAIRSKLVEKKEMPNYLDLFSFQALGKVKPEAVSVVH
jgi:NitT/TauT family transport system substrate-binding protein